jgi:hypothetical protein
VLVCFVKVTIGTSDNRDLFGASLISAALASVPYGIQIMHAVIVEICGSVSYW